MVHFVLSKDYITSANLLKLYLVFYIYNITWCVSVVENFLASC